MERMRYHNGDVILFLCNGDDFSLELTVTDSHFVYGYHHQAEMTSTLPSGVVFNRCALALWPTGQFFLNVLPGFE